jgi:hypothetical protein
MYLVLFPSNKFSPLHYYYYYYYYYKVFNVGVDLYIHNVHTKFCKKNQPIDGETGMVDTEAQTHTAWWCDKPTVFPNRRRWAEYCECFYKSSVFCCCFVRCFGNKNTVVVAVIGCRSLHRNISVLIGQSVFVT